MRANYWLPERCCFCFGLRRCMLDYLLKAFFLARSNMLLICLICSI